MSDSPSISGNHFEVVLFDVGGVLLTNGWDHVQRAAVLDCFELDRAAFEARHPEPYDALERDTITMEEYLQATIFYEPRSFTPEEFIEVMKVQSKPIPSNALAVLDEISASDRLLIGLLNNESRLLHEYRMDKYGIENYLDIQLSSCYLGLRKPDADIYRRALDILGRPADRVIFIDDRANNTAAACAAGIHAIQFLGEEQLRRDLKQIGIL
jgi:putative hydrolase of the HAD superfamily